MKIVPNKTKSASLALSPAGTFDIHDYVPYLINRAATVLVERFQDGLGEHGVTRLEWRVLAILSQRGPTRFGGLASLSALEPPTLSRIINALTRRRLVAKKKSGIDARGVVIETTEAGRSVVGRILPHAAKIEQIAFEGLSADEARFLLRLLQRVCENLAPWVPDDAARA